MTDRQQITDEVADHVNSLTAKDAEAIENRYWKQTLGTTSLSARGYRSFWD